MYIGAHKSILQRLSSPNILSLKSQRQNAKETRNETVIDMLFYCSGSSNYDEDEFESPCATGLIRGIGQTGSISRSSGRWCYGTRWSSNYTDDSWFTVDLGEVKDFDTIVIDWEAARARTFKVLVSNDKEQWTNVIDQDGTIEGQDGKQTIRLTTARARYVKLQGIQRATPYGYSFYAFEVHKRF